jgi:hypothetical protein
VVKQRFFGPRVKQIVHVVAEGENASDFDMTRNQYPPPSKAELEIIEKCHKLGVKVPQLGSFMDQRKKYPVTDGIAKLFAEELGKKHDWHLLAVIMQVGVTPKHRDIMLMPIVNVLRKAEKSLLNDTAINALGDIVLPRDAPIVADLLRDKNIGEDRILLVPIYARLAKKAAIPVLRKAVDDPDTMTYALHHLSILGDTSIENELLGLAKHPDAWRRKIARDALKRVEKNKLKLADNQIH